MSAIAVPGSASLEQAMLHHYGVTAATTWTVALDGPREPTRVLEYGAGAPAVLLHGGDGRGWNWAPMMASLGDTLHMHAVDPPGLDGPLDYADVAMRRRAARLVGDVLDGAGLESAVLVGGYFALAAAAERPERVRAVVLVGHPAGFPPAGTRSPWWRGRRHGLDVRAALDGIDRPRLVIWGDNEPAARHTATDGDCRFAILSDVGHFPHLEAPWASARLVKTFLDEHPEVAAAA